MADDKVLNLDQLYGEDKVIVVKWQGRDYELRHPKAMGPAEMVLINKMQMRVDTLQNAKDLNDAQAQEMSELMSKLIAAICPALDGNLTFQMQVQVLMFYTKSINAEQRKPTEKKVRTGRKSSRA